MNSEYQWVAMEWAKTGKISAKNDFFVIFAEIENQICNQTGNKTEMQQSSTDLSLLKAGKSFMNLALRC